MAKKKKRENTNDQYQKENREYHYRLCTHHEDNRECAHIMRTTGNAMNKSRYANFTTFINWTNFLKNTNYYHYPYEIEDFNGL